MNLNINEEKTWKLQSCNKLSNKDLEEIVKVTVVDDEGLPFRLVEFTTKNRGTFCYPLDLNSCMEVGEVVNPQNLYLYWYEGNHGEKKTTLSEKPANYND